MSGNAHGFGFPRTHRLRRPREFAAVMTFRCGVNGEYFRVNARPNGLAHPRLGLVISGRSIRRAAARNYCKRVIREVFRTEARRFGGVDLVVRSLAQWPARLQPAVVAELRDLLRCASNRCEASAGASRERGAE